MRIILKGISHRTVPVELREQLAIEPGRLVSGMTNKFLHPVIRSLKQAAEQGDIEPMKAVCAIFALAPLPSAQDEVEADRRACAFAAQLTALIA